MAANESRLNGYYLPSNGLSPNTLSNALDQYGAAVIGGDAGALYTTVVSSGYGCILDFPRSKAYVFERGSAVIETVGFRHDPSNALIEFVTELLEATDVEEDCIPDVALPPSRSREQASSDLLHLAQRAVTDHIWGPANSLALQPVSRNFTSEKRIKGNGRDVEGYSFIPHFLLGTYFGRNVAEEFLRILGQPRATFAETSETMRRFTDHLDEITQGQIIQADTMKRVDATCTGQVIREKMQIASAEVARVLAERLNPSGHAVIAAEYAAQHSPRSAAKLEVMMQTDDIQQLAKLNGHVSPSGLLTSIMKQPDTLIHIPDGDSVRAFELFQHENNTKRSSQVKGYHDFIRLGMSGAFLDSVYSSQGLVDNVRLGTGRSDFLILDANSGKASEALRVIKAAAQSRKFSYQQPQLSFRLLPNEVLAAKADYYWSWLHNDDGARVIPIDVKSSLTQGNANGHSTYWEQYMGGMMSSLCYAEMLGLFRISPNEKHRRFVASFHSLDEKELVRANDLITNAIERTSAYVASALWPVVGTPQTTLEHELRGIKPVVVHTQNPKIMPLVEIHGRKLARYAVARLEQLNRMFHGNAAFEPR